MHSKSLFLSVVFSVSAIFSFSAAAFPVIIINKPNLGQCLNNPAIHGALQCYPCAKKVYDFYGHDQQSASDLAIRFCEANYN